MSHLAYPATFLPDIEYRIDRALLRLAANVGSLYCDSQNQALLYARQGLLVRASPLQIFKKRKVV